MRLQLHLHDGITLQDLQDFVWTCRRLDIGMDADVESGLDDDTDTVFLSMTIGDVPPVTKAVTAMDADRIKHERLLISEEIKRRKQEVIEAGSKGALVNSKGALAKLGLGNEITFALTELKRGFAEGLWTDAMRKSWIDVQVQTYVMLMGVPVEAATRLVKW